MTVGISKLSLAAALLAAGFLAACTSDHDREGRQAVPVSGETGARAGAPARVYMDAQETILRGQLRGSGVAITRDGDAILLSMPGNITFESDAARIKPAFAERLDRVAGVLVEFPETMVDIVGHTDAAGSEAHNLQLSEDRALSVRDYLLAKGVSARRIVARGLGESMPVASNETAAGRALNRRVELALVPIRR